MKLTHSLLLTTLLLFTACGGGGSTNNSSSFVSQTQESTDYEDSYMSCQPIEASSLLYKAKQEFFKLKAPLSTTNLLVTDTSPLEFDKEGIYELFKTEYYWAEETRQDFDPTPYTAPQPLIDALKNEKDRWSFAITKSDYEDATTQASAGFGFRCQDVSTGCHVTYVRIDSPADRVGLKRSDVITKVNNLDATYSDIYNQAQTMDSAVSFSILRPNSNEECNCSITPREYTYKVAKGAILHSENNENVGYLRLDSFLGDQNIVDQFDIAFDAFKKENIEKLVIDLRYNGGGSVSVASKLLDKLSTSLANKEQCTLAWNDDYSQNNQTYRFVTDNNSLNLKQVLFLTTQGSASASELVISAMMPYLTPEDLVIVGDRTHGKPVGMGGRTDGNYYYFLINFVVKNALGFYDYFDGLPVTEGCQVEDDPYHDMGDPEESMLKAALHYVDTGSCQ